MGRSVEVGFGELVDFGQGEAGLIQGAEREVNVAARNESKRAPKTGLGN